MNKITITVYIIFVNMFVRGSLFVYTYIIRRFNVFNNIAPYRKMLRNILEIINVPIDKP